MEQTFPIVPASGKAFWFLAALFVFLLGLLALFGYFGYAARNARIVVSPGELRIVGGLYGRTLPLSSLNLQAAARVDLRSASDFSPRVRTNGIGLPGYQSGWFQLKNGEKALLFVTSPDVVRIPTRENYSVLLSVPDPDAFLQALRTAGA